MNLRAGILAFRSVRSMALRLASWLVVATLSVALPAVAQTPPPSRFADVNGVKLHYLVAGHGSPFRNDFAADPKRSISEADRRFYTKAYSQLGAMRAGFEVFRAFEQDAADFAVLAKMKLQMPMLVLTGEKASGQFLIDQGRLVADQVEGVVVKGSGHWLMEEAPDQVIPKLVEFLGR